jgi:glycosyltransferase involved in cell wall biosynthesis
MKKVLWISYLFPPLNCGVGRQVKIAKYLLIYGWMPVVLSVKGSWLRPFYDRVAVKDVPQNVNVYRTWSLESRLLMRYLPWLLHINPKWVCIPDEFIGWFPFAVMKGTNMIRSENVSAIFSTSMPNTCHLVAHVLKKRTGLPWVADFRDPWTQNKYVTYPSAILGLENKMEAAVVRSADRITTVTEPITLALKEKYPDEPPEKFVTVTHGFDSEDFPVSECKKKRESDKFVITYAGSLYLYAKPDAFLHAIKELLDEDEDISRRLQVRFVGNVSPAVRLCDELGLNKVITISKMVMHQDVFTYLFNSDVLLLIMGTTESDKKGSAGKLFEYMASGRPILALTPEGVAADIVRQANLGIVVHPEDKDGIKKAILELYHEHRNGNRKIVPNGEIIKQYDVRTLSGKFAVLFDQLACGCH